MYDITPNIQCWSKIENPLRDYLESLDRIYTLDVELALPGHRSLFTNCNERIEELKVHHRHRAEEVLEILRHGPQHAYQIASQMTWDIEAKSWEEFPIAQKWFATGEAIAHLRYLEDNGLVSHKMVGETIVYDRIL